MTLAEFLQELSKPKMHDRVLATLYYLKHAKGQNIVRVSELRLELKLARVKGARHANLSQALRSCSSHVASVPMKNAVYGWSITRSGEQHIEGLSDVSEVKTHTGLDVSTLRRVVDSVVDTDVRGYIEESVKCLEAGAIRACVVFLWAGAMRRIQVKMIALGASTINSAVTRHDPKARTLKTVDDFAYIKESTQLLAAQDLGLFDKNERDVLDDCLKLRNKCGHPGKYSPGPNKVRSFIEDIVPLAFT